MSDRRHATHIPLFVLLAVVIASCLSGTPCMASTTPPDEVTVELDGNEIQLSGNADEQRRELPRTDASESPVMGVLAAVAVISGGVAVWAHRKAQ